MVGEQKATPSSVPGTRPVKGKLCLLHTLLFSPTCDLIQRTEQSGSRVVGLGPSPSPGLEEDSQATRRCSVLGPGLSARAGKAGPGLVLVQFDQSESFLLALGFIKSLQTPSPCLETSAGLDAMNGEVGFSEERTPEAASRAPALVENCGENCLGGGGAPALGKG